LTPTQTYDQTPDGEISVDVVSTVVRVRELDRSLRFYCDVFSCRVVVHEAGAQFRINGEWATPRVLRVQFRNIEGHDIEQLRDGSRQVVLSPPQYAAGGLIYAYAEAITGTSAERERPRPPMFLYVPARKVVVVRGPPTAAASAGLDIVHGFNDRQSISSPREPSPRLTDNKHLVRQRHPSC